MTPRLAYQTRPGAIAKEKGMCGRFALKAPASTIADVFSVVHSEDDFD